MSMMRMPSKARAMRACLPSCRKPTVPPCPQHVNTLGCTAQNGGNAMSVELIIEGAVAKVVLNRPDKLNALTREMRVQLREHFERLRFDDAIRAILVTGEGRAFCTGADVGGMQRNGLRAERERLM